MKIDDLVKQTGQWLKGTGPSSEIVVSSRIRLARNIKGISFSQWANDDQKQEVLSLCEPAITSLDEMKGNLFVLLDVAQELDKQLLLERHLISREHTENGKARAVAISDQEIISIMINEEDHLRMQTITSGFDLIEAWRLMETIDRRLGKKLAFAFSSSFGYLTACPTNVGTGMRCSVMLHLPALVITKQIGKALQAIAKVGLTARGFYGEGTEASGNFYQISNQVTLGHTEEDIVEKIESIVRQVVEYEKKAREGLLKQKSHQLEDMVWRAYGILCNARILNSKEAMELLSHMRLGIDMELIKDISRKKVNELIIFIQPAHLQKIESKTLNAPARDVTRAHLIRTVVAAEKGKKS